jgi:hypothetical protein
MLNDVQKEEEPDQLQAASEVKMSAGELNVKEESAHRLMGRAESKMGGCSRDCGPSEPCNEASPH